MRAVVTGVGHHLPERVVTTAEVEALVAERGGFSLPGGIVQLLTGVRQRHWAAADETSSDYAAAAGRAALDHAGVHPMAVDVLISASASHDVAEPATSAIVQSKLGCRNAAVMDVKNACNGFLNGLDVAAALVQTGRAGRVLVTAGEVLSPAIDWDIHGMADLRGKLAGLTLGDAGAAFLVEASDEPDDPGWSADGGTARGIRQGDFTTDGDHWELSTVLAGGNLVRHRDVGRYFHCRSDDLAKLAVRHLPDLFTKARARVGWENDEIALVVPHQVSRAVVVDLAKLWDYPLSRCMVTVDRFGNTAAASVPLAASVAVAEGRLSPGDRVVLVAGAAGFSAGVLPVVW